MCTSNIHVSLPVHMVSITDLFQAFIVCLMSTLSPSPSVSVRVFHRSIPLCPFVELHWVQTRKGSRICLSTAWSVWLYLSLSALCSEHQTCHFLYRMAFIFCDNMWKLWRMDTCAYMCVYIRVFLFASGLLIAFILPELVQLASGHFTFCFNMWLLCTL